MPPPREGFAPIPAPPEAVLPPLPTTVVDEVWDPPVAVPLAPPLLVTPPCAGVVVSVDCAPPRGGAPYNMTMPPRLLSEVVDEDPPTPGIAELPPNVPG
jgi:hypothetical protein